MGLTVAIYRLPGIDGPGRAAFDRQRGGRAQRIAAPGQVFARIHVADREAYTAHSRTLGMPASPSAEGTGALDHLAFTGDDHEEAVARLERRGIEAKRNTVPGIGMRQLFFKDPNGVKVEINVMPAEGGKED